MDIRSLRCFLALAEYLNYSRAAEQLYISQPTVSIRIQALEEELGVLLFNRSHRHVYLTDAGAALVPIARNILAAIDSIPATLRSAQRNSQTVHRLCIAYDPTEDRTDLHPLNQILQAFRKTYPNVELEVKALSGMQYQKMLLSGEADIAIMVIMDGEPIPEDILSIPIVRDSTVLVTYHADGLTLDEILAERGITFLNDALHSCWRTLYSDYLCKHISVPYETKLVSDVASLFFGLQYGQGVSFLPYSYLENMPKSGLRIFPTDLPDVNLTLMWNKHIMNPAVQTIVNEANNIVYNKGSHKRKNSNTASR